MGTHEPTAADWERLGRAVEDRRFQLDLSQEALAKRGGPSHQIVRNIERGLAADYRDTTFRKLDRALQWRDGTARKILAGTASKEEMTEVVERTYERAGGGGATVTGTARAELGFAAEAGDDDATTILRLAGKLVPLLAARTSSPAARAATRHLTEVMAEVAAEIAEG